MYVSTPTYSQITTDTAPETIQQGSAVRGASLLIVLQIASRAVTFVANQLLLRFLTAQLLGIATQLEVYYLSVLFFARESLRVAIQRQGSPSRSSGRKPDEKSGHGGSGDGNPDARDSQAVVNIAHLSLVLGLGSSVGLGWAYLRYVDAATARTPYLGVSLRLYGIAAVTELLSEPAFVILQYRLRFGPRAAAESVATFLRCLATFGAANWAWRQGLDLGVLPFALGQLAYGTGLLGVYAWHGARLASSERFSLLPFPTGGTSLAQKRSEDKTVKTVDNDYVLGYFFKPTLRLASSMTAQSFVKHLLTQGDTFLVSVLSDPKSQGIYALANNYGSLLARLVFQPIEESSRNYFSKLLSSSTPTPTPTPTPIQNPKSESESAPQPQPALVKARTDLLALLKAYILLSSVILTLGPPGAPLLIQLIAGAAWSRSGAGLALAQYCAYIPLLALNGASEAFVASVASEADVHAQSLWMGGFSVAFGVAGWVFLRVLRLGAAGLVCANAINMACRIVWSAAFISRWFAARGLRFSFWRDVVPGPDGLALWVGASAAVWGSLGRAGVSVGGVSEHVFRDLVTVVGVAVPYVCVIAYAERKYLLDCYRSLCDRKAT
ncbi:Rft-1-domain-containing protein [Whalleya microplaca]|nr:Rft-1-domain-containing protein [Whalleya microplaca]